ncbi:MAG: DMT family transporter [Sphingomonadales bacterium]|nr:DMT family transporter [Sphingomonadales bacterium]
MLVLVMLMWSGNSIVARAIHAEVPPFTLAFWRWAGASLIAVPLAWRHIMADRETIARRWPTILLLGLVGVGSFNAFMYSGLQYTTAANSLLVQAAIPALVLLFDFLLFRVAPRLAQIFGCILAAFGVLIIIFRGDPAAMASLHFNVGDLLVLCAVVLWSLYTVLLRTKPAIHGLSFLALTILIGTVVMAPFSVHELQSRDVILTPGVLAGIAYVSILPSVIAYFLYNLAVETIGAGDAGNVVNLQPLFGALLASLVLGEPIHGYHLFGMAVILAGIGIPLLLPAAAPAPAR